MGRWLFFVSERPGDGMSATPCGGGDMYLARQSPAGGWSKPQMLKCAPEGPNTSGGERSPSLVETWYGTFLFYSTNGGSANQDIYVSQLGADGTFGPGTRIAALSTAGFDDIMPNVRVREDGALEMVFSSNRTTWGRNKPAFGIAGRVRLVLVVAHQRMVRTAESGTCGEHGGCRATRDFVT